MTGSRRTPATFIKPVPFRSSEATKKGKREGNTTLSQSFSPFEADSTAVSEKIIRLIIKMMHIKGSINPFIWTTRICLKGDFIKNGTVIKTIAAITYAKAILHTSNCPVCMNCIRMAR